LIDGEPKTDGLRCTNGHFVCDECFSDYVRITWADRVQQDLTTVPVLNCAIPDCGAVISERDLARHVSEAALEAYQNTRLMAMEAHACAKAQAEIQKRLDQLQGPENAAGQRSAQREALSGAAAEMLNGQLRAAFPNALMCPRCKFGPVDQMACNDFGAHHNQQVGQGVVIDNRCPICHFFGRSRADWRPWDGVRRESFVTPAQQLVEMSGCTLAEAQHALQAAGDDVNVAAMRLLRLN
jgi:hypothetical protein